MNEDAEKSRNKKSQSNSQTSSVANISNTAHQPIASMAFFTQTQVAHAHTDSADSGVHTMKQEQVDIEAAMTEDEEDGLASPRLVSNSRRSSRLGVVILGMVTMAAIVLGLSFSLANRDSEDASVHANLQGTVSASSLEVYAIPPVEASASVADGEQTSRTANIQEASSSVDSESIDEDSIDSISIDEDSLTISIAEDSNSIDEDSISIAEDSISIDEESISIAEDSISIDDEDDDDDDSV
jgi:hypothetical protein